MNLDIDREIYKSSVSTSKSRIEKAINMFINHPSVLRIKDDRFEKGSFSFQPISEHIMQLVINNIDASKAYQKNNILPKILKENCDICTIVLCSDIT